MWNCQRELEGLIRECCSRNRRSEQFSSDHTAFGRTPISKLTPYNIHMFRDYQHAGLCGIPETHADRNKMDETLILNLVGTVAFGLSGGIIGVRKKMDLFGVLVLAVATGLVGGIMPDLILVHTPPTTLADWRYLAAAGVAGLLVFVDYRQIIRWNRFVTAFDAAGLAIFTVTGTTIALAAGLGPVPAALLGMLTGIGGGGLRGIHPPGV